MPYAPPSSPLPVSFHPSSSTSSSSSSTSSSPLSMSNPAILRPPVRSKSKTKFESPTFSPESNASSHRLPLLPRSPERSALLTTPVPPRRRSSPSGVAKDEKVPFPLASPDPPDPLLLSIPAEIVQPTTTSSSNKQPSLPDKDTKLPETTSQLKSPPPRRISALDRSPGLRLELGSLSSAASTTTSETTAVQSNSSPQKANDAIDEPRFSKHSRSQSHNNISRAYPPTPTPTPIPFSTPKYIRKKSGELVKPSLKSKSASMFSTPSAETPDGASPRQRENGLRVNVEGLTMGVGLGGGARSEPTTPMGPKMVHFDAKLEHVKLFLAEQKPLAVSRDGSPTETSEGGEDFSFFDGRARGGMASSDDEAVRTSLELCVVNMPGVSALDHLVQKWDSEHVRLESLVLTDDARAVRGTVLVRNLAYGKWVAARFTMDRWQTTSEVSARYTRSLSIPNGGDSGKQGGGGGGGEYDRFEFTIRLVDFLSKIWDKTLHVAVRYTCDGFGEMWDSNGGENYTVVFKRKKMGSVPFPTSTSSAASAVGGMSRGGGGGNRGSAVGGETTDEEEEEDDKQVKVAALKKSLEKVMHGPSSRGLHVRTGSYPDAHSHTHTPPPTLNASFVNNRSAADVLLRVGKQQLQLPALASTLSPNRDRDRASFNTDTGPADSPVSPRRNREGTLAGRYDIGSSLRNAATGTATATPSPMTSTGGGIPFPRSYSPSHYNPMESFTSTPLNFSSTTRYPNGTGGRGLSRNALTPGGHESSSYSPPFRTSSDSDLVGSFTSTSSGALTPSEYYGHFPSTTSPSPSSSSSSAKYRNHQRSYFASGPSTYWGEAGFNPASSLSTSSSSSAATAPSPSDGPGVHGGDGSLDVGRATESSAGSRSGSNVDMMISASPRIVSPSLSRFNSFPPLMGGSSAGTTSGLPPNTQSWGSPSIFSTSTFPRENPETLSYQVRPENLRASASSDSDSTTGPIDNDNGNDLEKKGQAGSETNTAGTAPLDIPRDSRSSSMDSSAWSTPSGTDDSSPPSSLSETVLSSPIDLDHAIKQSQGPDPGNLSSFLDQFCFYTGPDSGLSSRRSHSDSNVSEYFAVVNHHHGHGHHSPHHVVDSMIDMSGRTTPTAIFGRSGTSTGDAWGLRDSASSSSITSMTEPPVSPPSRATPVLG